MLKWWYLVRCASVTVSIVDWLTQSNKGFGDRSAFHPDFRQFAAGWKLSEQSVRCVKIYGSCGLPNWHLDRLKLLLAFLINTASHGFQSRMSWSCSVHVFEFSIGFHALCSSKSCLHKAYFGSVLFLIQQWIGLHSLVPVLPVALLFWLEAKTSTSSNK